jgi:hypothetical protein
MQHGLASSINRHFREHPGRHFASGFAPWLERSETDAGELSKLPRPYPANLMACHPVSKRVNSVKVDEERCAAPVNLSLLDDSPNAL